MQYGLGAQQPGDAIGGGRLRDEACDQAGGALLEHSAGRAVGLALDPAVGRVGGSCGEAGEFQSTGVGPGAVVVAVEQQYRAVGDDGVDELPGGHTAGEGLHRPAAARDPLPLGVGRGIGGDPAQVLLEVGGAGEVALAQLDAREDGMDMGVGEAGDQQPPGQVDHLRTGSDQLAHLASSDGDDPFAADSHRVGTTVGRVGGEGGTAGEDEIGVGGHAVLLGLVRLMQLVRQVQ